MAGAQDEAGGREERQANENVSRSARRMLWSVLINSAGARLNFISSHMLCDLGQAIKLLCVSVSLPVKRGIVI